MAIYRDPVMHQSARNPIVTEQDAFRWLDAQQQGWTDGGRLSFAALSGEAAAAPDHVLGNVVLKGYAAGQDSAEVGYWTAPAARRRGVASAAVVTLTAWAFGSLGPAGLQRIELIHQQDNLASCRVAQKSGYALTGLLRPILPPYLTGGIFIPGTRRVRAHVISRLRSPGTGTARREPRASARSSPARAAGR
jgi:RimJ/RimL family protein N-acetyltransferase